MDQLSLQNPVFATYVIAAIIMILKAVSMSWLTVARMMQVKGKFPGATIWATGPSAEISSAIVAVMSHGECSISWPEARRSTAMRASNLIPANRMGYAQSHI